MRLVVHVTYTEDANSEYVVLLGESQKEFSELREDKSLFTTAELSSLIPHVCSFCSLIFISDLPIVCQPQLQELYHNRSFLFSRPHDLSSVPA
jgi:hypothetical protein